jgi:hypothetical protein
LGTDVQYLEATLQHAEAFAPLLRAGDVEEGRALGLEPREALVESVLNSSEAYAVTFNGELGAMFGVVPLRGTVLGTRGLVWILSGRAVDRYPLAFLKASRQVLDALRKHFDVLTNVVDARYEASLRWLRWLNCELGPPAPFGPKGMLFCRFTARRA